MIAGHFFSAGESMHAVLRPLLILAGLALLGSTLQAQLPAATGRQIALSQPQWRLFIPDGFTPQGGEVDLLVHFHGDPQTVWNNAAYAELDAVIVTVNYSGLSSAYSNPFADTALFGRLLDDARTRLAAQPGFAPGTEWGDLAVSSFSAGYGAVRRILATPAYFDSIDSLLAADSLYATTASDGTALDSQMVDYKRFADAAAAGDKRFIFTHSEVETRGYQSTAETGDELMRHLNLTPTPTNETGLGPIRYYHEAERGGFKLWGARGADGEGHLNHLRYLGEWLDDLGLGAADLRADYNGDGLVDAADYTVWKDNWLSFNAPGDGDRDGFTGNSDYDVWTASYGERLDSPPVAVPEPGGLPHATIGLVALATGLRRGQSGQGSATRDGR